jgi:hypothetical protein
MTYTLTSPPATTDSPLLFAPTSLVIASMLSDTCAKSRRATVARLLSKCDPASRRVHVMELGVLDETGSRLSEDEIELMYRHGNEPFSWEV